MLTRILSLDLGTASIGWAIRDLTIEKSREAIIHSGVVIFPEGFGTNKSGQFSLAAERRKARLIRRQLYRRRLRKYATLKRLIKADMVPLSLEEAQKWAKPAKGNRSEYPLSQRFHQWLRLIPANGPLRASAFANIYELRAAAEKGELGQFASFGFSTEELLGRIFYNYAQRRGFKTNAKDGRGGETGTVKDGIKKLLEELDGKTMAEYFAGINPFKARIRKRYLAREMFEEEFDRITNSYGDALNGISDDLKRIIFYVRPLKSQKEKVGSCSLEAGKRRLPLSHPDFEMFRLRQFVQNLRVEHPNGVKTGLNLSETNKLIDWILEQPQARQTKKDLKNWLTELYQAEIRLTVHEGTTSPPCPCCKMLKDVLGPSWQTRSLKRAYQNGPKKGYCAKVGYTDLWHFLREVQERPEKFKTEDPISDYATALGLGSSAANRMNKYVDEEMPSGYSSLSLFAIRRILEMMDNGHPYHTAVLLAGMKRVLGEELWNHVGEDIINDLSNHVADLPFEATKTKTYNDLLNRLLEAGEVASDKDIEDRIKFHYGTQKWNQLKKNEAARATEILESVASWLKEAEINPGKAKFKASPSLLEFVNERIKDELRGVGQFDEYKLERKIGKLYHHSAISKWKEPEFIIPADKDADDGFWQLPSPYTGAIQNPAAMRVLHQCRKLINFLLAEGHLDRNCKVVVEMARELNDSNQRAAIEEWQRRQERERQNIRQFIVEHLGRTNPDEDLLERYRLWLEQIPLAAGPDTRSFLDKALMGSELGKRKSDDLVQKMQLWREQNGICLYSGKPISPSDVLDGTSTQIEHTIPRSISNDTTMENLTLATSIANARKGKKIPFEIGPGDSTLSDYSTILQRIKPWEERADDLEKQIKKKSRAVRAAKGSGNLDGYNKAVKERWLLKFERNYWRAKIRRFKMEEVEEGFSRRQLTDTQVITKYAAGWLKTCFNHVKGTKGTLTAQLRKSWGLQSMYEKKDRTNHTHHLVDALVNVMIEPGLYNQLSAAYRKTEELRHKEIRLPMPWDTFVTDIENLCDNTLVYHVHRDNTLRPSKFAIRNRSGKIIGYKQGKGIKAPLHMETALANVRTWEEKSDGSLKWKRGEEGSFITTFATRKEMVPGTKTIFPKLKQYADERKSEFEKEGKREILPVLRLRMKDGKRIELKRMTEADLPNLKPNDLNAHFLDAVAKEGLAALKNDGFFLPVYKARIPKRVQTPPKIRNVPVAFQHPERSHKHSVHYENDSNYAMAIYRSHQGKKEKRTFLVQPYLGLNPENAKHPFPLTLHEKGIDYDLAGPTGGMQVFRMGQRVLLYENTPEEIWNDTSPGNLGKRLYKTVGIFNKSESFPYGRQTFQKHDETGFEKLASGEINRIDAKSAAFRSDDSNIPVRVLLHTQINALVEGIDFRMNHLGEIEKC